MNLFLTRAVSSMTPIEKWCGNKPLFSHLRMFWCDFWEHISDVYIKKLDAKSHAYIMMGYSKESKAYQLFDPVKQQIIIRRNVIFDGKSSCLKLLNSSSGLLNSDPFDIFLDSRLSNPLGILGSLFTSLPKSTSSWSTLTKTITLLIDLLKGQIVHRLPIYLDMLLRFLN